METIQFQQWTLSVDREATRAAYADVKEGGSSTCACLFCRNWVAARAKGLPQPLLDVLEQFAIDPAKDIEVFELFDDRGTDRMYGGWYVFVGTVEGGPTKRSAHGWDWVPVSEDLHVGFAEGCDLCHDAFEGQPVSSLSFFTYAWNVLDFEEVRPPPTRPRLRAPMSKRLRQWARRLIRGK